MSVSHAEGVRQVREMIASGRQTADDYRQRARQYEQLLWEMRVSGDYDVAAYMQYEAAVNVIREALGEPPFPPPTTSIWDDAALMQALDHGYDPDWRTRSPDYRRCVRCGQQGESGRYPFSTIADGNICDDCL